MLSFLNTVIGFAATFALFSLIVTALTQVGRTLLRVKNRYLVERLLRLFGELADARRFVAALLTHPSLEGGRGASLYQTLTDPALPGDDKQVAGAIEKVLGPQRPGTRMGALRSAWRQPFPRTSDLDKQAVKDIATTVYARIGPLVDSEVSAGGPRDSFPWAPQVLHALSAAETAAPVVTPFRGRLWALATAAFPEGQGKSDPIKTYVAAFYDEAQASASDQFTLVMRVTTIVIAALVVFVFNLDALRILGDLSKADPARIDAYANTVQALASDATAKGGEQLKVQLQEAKDVLAAAANAPVRFCFLGTPLAADGEPPCDCAHWKPSALPGNLLSLFALSFGAPFWFEILKSAIDLKSAFTPKGGSR